MRCRRRRFTDSVQILCFTEKNSLIMGILSWIIFGFIAGALAKWIMPGKNEPQGCILTILLGIAGAVLGGFIGTQLLNTGPVNDWSLGSFGLAVGGALLVLWIYGMIAKRKS